MFGFSIYCLFTARKLNARVLCLLLCFWWMSSATYRPGRWTTAFSVVFSGSVWTQIFLKRWRGRRRKKDCFSLCGRGLRANVIGDRCACRVCMHSVCQVPLKLDEFICLLHCRPCNVTVAHMYIAMTMLKWYVVEIYCWATGGRCSSERSWDESQSSQSVCVHYFMSFPHHGYCPWRLPWQLKLIRWPWPSEILSWFTVTPVIVTSLVLTNCCSY